MRFGIQLFGACKNISGSPKEIFPKIKEAGYCMTEPCVMTEVPAAYRGIVFEEKAFQETALLIKEAGLEIAAVHLLSGDGTIDVSLATRLHKQAGITSFVVKLPPFEKGGVQHIDGKSDTFAEETAVIAAEKAVFALRQAAEALREEGAELLLHNEEKDIRTKIDGMTAYEWVLRRVGTVLKAEVDVGEVFFAGEDPVELLERLQPWVKMVHYKDFTVPGDRSTETAIGRGSLPAKKIVRFCTENGIPQIVDMDDPAANNEKGTEGNAAATSFLEQMAVSKNMLQRFCNDRSNTRSFLNIMDSVTGEVTTLRAFDGVIEAPNWIPGKETLVYNANGKLYGYQIDTDTLVEYDAGGPDNLNNDHVLSFDGTEVAYSNTGGPAEGYAFSSKLFRTLLKTKEEGAPAAIEVMPHTPSFLHGWSPDNKELTYCGFRNIDGKTAVDIYVVNADGSGEEKRLTNVGFNDGPEYSPDGKTIWFHSDRSGLMQVFRMDRNGENQIQMTHQDQNNWFPHISPDGEKILYIAYAKDALDSSEHLPNMPVSFWIMNQDGSDPKKILSFLGGQGSLNVNSWSGDSRRFAFVSYCQKKEP